jgi:hypothetical protein
LRGAHAVTIRGWPASASIGNEELNPRVSG